MRIFSWNMLFRNRRLDEALDFLRTADFDVMCLQEVPERFLSQIRTLPYHFAEALELERIFSDVLKTYVVTLSRHPIVGQGVIPLPDYWNDLPFRTKFFVYLMRPLSWSKIRNHNGLYVDIEQNGKIVRVFNLHLTLATPARRMLEFERAMAERGSSLPAIVCGDFNIIESPRVSLLNWLTGGSISDAVLYKRERTHIEERFVEYELLNPLRGSKTHAFAGSQLDHILVSKALQVIEADVVHERYGSDHHPIYVEVA